MIRVDHAGELGADRIYWGQMAVLGRDPKVGPVIQEMWNQEKGHLKQFELLALKHRAPRSILSPVWSFGGFFLGAASALLGPKSAMACTVAVEKVITEHYNDQIRQLISDDPNLHAEMIETISKFRDDEQHHHDTGLEHEAEQAIAYRLFSKSIETICRISIKIAERI
jgi:ubiquinone biosynthesis monooxygenase Coq7